MKRFFTVLFLSLSIGLLSAQTYDQWIDSSFVYLEVDRLDSAEVALRNAMTLEPANPLNPFLLNNLGTIQRRQHKWEDALISYTAALGSQPQNATFLSARASLYVEMGSTENALIDYSTLLLVEPNNEEALYQRGLLYLKLRDYDRSEQDFKRMLELNPNGLYAYLGMASYYKLTDNQLEAERTYNFILDKDPDNAQAYAGRAELYLFQEKASKVQSDVNKAFALSETFRNDPYLYILRAKAKALLYEKAGALQDIDKAEELGYDSVEANNLRKLIR